MQAHYLKEELYRRVSADSAVFEFIQAGSLDGIWYVDLENPGPAWMSPRLKELFGYGDKEVPNTREWWRKTIFPEDLPTVLENLSRHLADPQVPFDQISRYRHKNGSTVWVRCRGMAIRDETGNPIRMLGAHSDVTAIKQAEERLRALFEASPDMYCVVDLETGAVSECNQVLISNTGRNEIAGTPFVELWAGDCRREAKALLHRARIQADTSNQELRLNRADEEPLAVLLSARATKDETGRSVMQAWCRDISYLKRFSNVEVLLAALRSAVVVADEQMVISSANTAAEQMFGYSKGGLVGQHFAGLLEESSKVAELGTAMGVDFRGKRADGSTFPIHIELSPLRLGEGTFRVAAIADLSAREGFQNALLESEHRFRQLTESLPQLVWTCGEDGTCDYLGPQWVAYTGIPEEVQLKLGWVGQIHPDDRDTIVREWFRTVEKGLPFEFEERLKRKDGEYRWFVARAIPLRNVEGRIVKWFGSSTDIHEKREAQAALEREQKRLANVIELAPAVFSSLAMRPDGTTYFPYVSPGFFDLYGISSENLEKDASDIFALIHKDDFQAVMNSIKESAETLSVWKREYRIEHAANGQRWLEAQSTPTRQADGGIVWHGFITDITERKQVEADQQFLFQLGAGVQAASTPLDIARVATEMMANHFGVARCSLITIGIDGQEATVLWQHSRNGSQATTAAGSYPLQAWTGKEVAEGLALGRVVAIDNTEIDARTAALYSGMFRGRGIQALLAVPLRRSERWVSLLNLVSEEERAWTGREQKLALAAVERVWPAFEAARASEAERAMHASLVVSQQRLELALQSVAVGIWEYDAVTEERAWDARSRAIFGFPPELVLTAEIIGDCVYPEDRAAVERGLREFRDPAGSGHFETEHRVVPWNGGPIRHVYSQGQMHFETEGKGRRCVRGIGTMQDVTLLKKGEQDLRRVNQELEQFAYAAAHDLQEPLRNVGLATQILAGRYKGQFDSDADSLLKVAVEGPMRMQAMVKDLLAYSRALAAEEGAVLRADANEVLALAIKNLLVAIEEKQAQISWEKLPHVKMSDLHLLQLFQNLIGNSLKYSGDKKPVIHISASWRAGECVLSVRDNGLGIEPRYHDRAFGVFKRLHSGDVPGTGIGLALCKRIVEHYGGKIWIESQPGQWTNILFTPPLADEGGGAWG